MKAEAAMKDKLANSKNRLPEDGLSPLERSAASPRRGRMTMAYVGMLLFILVYFARPNDWIPGLLLFPFAKIAGMIALAGFLWEFLREPKGILSLPVEIRYVLFLFAYLMLTVFFSSWRGGSFDVVVEGFSKVVVIALCLSMVVRTFARLRLLIFLQTGAVAVMAILVAMGQGTALVGKDGMKRVGAFGVLENPNEFAFAAAMVFPFAIAFLLQTRNVISKAFWTSAAFAMAYGVVVSLSRGGLLAFVIGGVFVLWEFGFKGRRPHLFFVTLILVGGLVLAAPGNFGTRVESIFDGSKDETGSRYARWGLLIKAWDTTLEHPLFGLGPGNFSTLEGTFWHGAHNTYAQLAAEAGIPSLILFLMILGRSFGNLKRAKDLAKNDRRHVLLLGALRANLACYTIGAFFGDTAFHFFPYLLVGYISAFYRIMTESEAAGALEQQFVAENLDAREGGNGRKRNLAWTTR